MVGKGGVGKTTFAAAVDRPVAHPPAAVSGNMLGLSIGSIEPAPSGAILKK
jgi:anion-transporting  ArsA/GET3 family ATPase